MHTNKALLFFLALCVVSTVFMVDAKAGASPGINLGVIPDNYHLTFGSGRQIIHVDTSVTRTGKPSIRLDQHTASDVNFCREVDGTWYNVKPGDHIVFKVWVKTSASGLSSDPSLTPGGRIGIDFYGHTSAGYGILYSANDATKTVTEPSWYGKPYGPNDKIINNWWVRYGSGWTQIGWDVYVPSGFFPYVRRNGIVRCTPHQVDSFVVWLDGRSTSNPGKVWFADGEIYINPSSASTASQPLPRNMNVQIAVSSATASSYNAGHPPSLAIDGIESIYNYWETNDLVPEGRVPQWLRLDLGRVCGINTFTTHFYDGDVRTYTYYIQVSNDSSSWTTIVFTKTGSGSVTDTFSQVGARFVRITVTANTAKPAAHIEEIKVFGFS